MAYIVMAYAGMAYIVMVPDIGERHVAAREQLWLIIVMAYLVMAYIIMVPDIGGRHVAALEDEVQHRAAWLGQHRTQRL